MMGPAVRPKTHYTHLTRLHNSVSLETITENVEYCLSALYSSTQLETKSLSYKGRLGQAYTEVVDIT